MRIAIPVTGDRLDQHFGHCESFAFFDVDPESRTITTKSIAAAPDHQPGLLPGWLKDRGVTVIIAGGMGVHARSLCEELSIQVIAGAPADATQALVKRHLEGVLETVDQVCHHH